LRKVLFFERSVGSRKDLSAKIDLHGLNAKASANKGFIAFDSQLQRRSELSTSLQIEIIVYIMVQAAMFGIGIALALCSSFSTFAMQLLLLVVGVSAILSSPVAWMATRPSQARLQSQTAPPRVPASHF
jgi:hypothetical protein